MTSENQQHRHRWIASSSHRVSEGLVVYQRCDCGEWRVTSTPVHPVVHPEIARIRKSA
ncbi:hypothetical protein OG394_24980 [Kribbella sp. NBC_01245]|uniref:hypothetical protein n=1 Tax=Kribbella sp. NBC_01245 TaxID=2903578 RepID=UPI002E288689|nr:hypothetical protein [Kribbella sp. NBC_01245]